MSYLYVIDAESLLPEPRSHFDSKRLDDKAAAEYLVSRKLWFWHFTDHRGPRFLRLEQIAALAGLTGAPGYSLTERQVKLPSVLETYGPNTYLLFGDGPEIELLTPKRPTD